MIFKVTIMYSVQRDSCMFEFRSPLERRLFIEKLKESIDPHLTFVLEEYPDPEDEGVEDPWFTGIAENDDCE